MKTEDIDKRIGMPDVDKEWARFEQEVIDPHQQPPSMGRTKRKPLPHRGGRVWKGGLLGIGIAASVALLLIYNIGKTQKEQPLMAQVEPTQPQHVSEPARVPAKEIVAEVSKPVIAPRKELALAKADASATTGLDIPAREYAGPVQKPKEDVMASTPEEREEIERMIANATIVPTSADLGSGTTMRLRGTGSGPSVKDRIDSTLILVNGEPLPDSLKQRIMGNDMDDIDTYMPRYFSQQGLLIDSVYVHKDSEFTAKYGGRAKYGVIEITTVPDTYCDAYVRKHPKLKKKYQRVEGYVVDNNGKPLTEAWVHVKRERAVLKKHPELDLAGAATDSTGHYVLWLPKDADIMLRAEQAGYKSFEFSPSDKDIVTHHLEKTHNMRLRGNQEPTPELQGQIAGLPPIDIRRVKNDYRRTVNKQAPDTILTLVNGKEDEAFLKYLHGMPYWSRTFIYDYFFERNQLFIRQYRPEGDEINKYAHLFNGRDIRFILDYQSRPYKPVSQFTPDELKARRLAYLLRCYREGKNNQDNHGMPSPDLFDTPAEERLFGLLGVKYWQGNRFEKFGHVSRDSRGTYIPLERHTQFTVQDEIWQENGEWLGMEDDERFNAVIKELDEAANGASSSLVEPGDSIVAMAFIYGGKVAKGALHESDVMWEKPFKDKVKGSIFEFTPDEDAPSYWTAEIYYSTQFPRYMVVYLNSVDKLYASECPDILNIRYKRLSGVVQDEEGKPVGHATVGFRDRPYFSDGVSADSLGRFELMLPNYIDTIRASWINYQTQKIRVLPTDSVLTIRLKKINWERLRKSEEKSLSSWKILLNSVSLQHKKKASEE